MYSDFPTTPLLWPMFKEAPSTPQELADAKKRDEAAPQTILQPPAQAVAGTPPGAGGTPAGSARPAVTLPQPSPPRLGNRGTPAPPAGTTEALTTVTVDDVEYVFQGAVRSGVSSITRIENGSRSTWHSLISFSRRR